MLLPPDRRLEGSVVDEQGRPLSDVFLSTEFYGNLTQEIQTDANGRFELDGLLHVAEIIKVYRPEWGLYYFYYIPTNGSWDFVLPEPRDSLGGNVVVRYGRAISQEQAKEMKAADFVENVRQRLIAMQHDARRRLGKRQLDYD